VNRGYNNFVPEGVGSSREFCYLVRSSVRTRITSAVTNRQSMAIVIRTRIQDDFSPNALTSFALARPAGRSSGLRTDGPIFRTDLHHRFPNTQRRRDQSISGIALRL
jgi:hypothetical protein